MAPALETSRFVCPECAETVEVDAPVRREMLDRGCVVCGAAVSASDFS